MSLLKNDSKESAVIQNIDLLVDSQSGIELLKELLLSLAIRGKLNERTSNSSNLLLTYDLKALRLEEDRLWGLDFLQDSPETWVQLPLAKLGDWGSGGTPSRGNKEYYGGDIPWIIIGDLNDGLVTKASNSITTRGLQESSASKVPVGAVLVAMYGSIGKCGIAGIECATNQAIAHCIPNKSIISTEYLFYLIRALKPRLFKQGRGLAQQNISQTILKHLMVMIPPLEEQEAIISTIQELMALCDQLEIAKKSRNEIEISTRKSAVDAVSTALTQEELQIAWKRIQQNWEVIVGTPESIESLRNLILSLAISGNLTKDSSPQDSVEELLDKASKILNPYPEISDERFAIPSHWKWVSLASVAEHQLGKMLHTAKMKGARRLYLRSVNVRPDGTIDLKDLNEMLIPESELEKYSVKNGDLFVNEGGDVGRNAIFDLEIEFNLAFQNQLHRLRPVCGIESRYLQFVLRQAKSQGVISQMSSGVTIQHFSASALRRFAIPLPPLSEQKLIVEKVNHLMKFCDELEREILEATHIAEKFARSVVSA